MHATAVRPHRCWQLRGPVKRATSTKAQAALRWPGKEAIKLGSAGGFSIVIHYTRVF